MVSDASQRVGKPCLWVDAIELCSFDQRIGDGGGFAAALLRNITVELEFTFELVD